MLRIVTDVCPIDKKRENAWISCMYIDSFAVLNGFLVISQRKVLNCLVDFSPRNNEQTTNEISHNGYTMFYRKGRRNCKARKYSTKDNYDI